MTNRHTRPRSWKRAAAAAVLAIFGTAGCGNLPAGGLTGEATVVVSGDATVPAPSPQVSVLPAFSPPALDSEDGEPEGEIEVEFMLFLVSESGSALRLGEDEIRVRLDLRGRNEADAVRERVPAVRYTGLQMVFTEIKVEVESGLINGVPFTGEIRVKLEDISLLVERPVDLDLSDGGSVELVVDLNTPSWLQAVDPITLTVDETVFQNLVDVVAR